LKLKRVRRGFWESPAGEEILTNIHARVATKGEEMTQVVADTAKKLSLSETAVSFAYYRWKKKGQVSPLLSSNGGPVVALVLENAVQDALDQLQVPPPRCRRSAS